MGEIKFCDKCGKDMMYHLPGYSCKRSLDEISFTPSKYAFSKEVEKRDTESLLHETQDKYTALLFKYDELVDKHCNLMVENYDLKVEIESMRAKLNDRDAEVNLVLKYGIKSTDVSLLHEIIDDLVKYINSNKKYFPGAGN